MNREEVIEKLTPIARQIFADENMVLNDELSALNVANWTSLSFMQFLTEIENQFGFKFNDGDFETPEYRGCYQCNRKSYEWLI